jgi:signal transduction histidine kinase
MYLLHGLVVNFVVSLLTWTITIVWISVIAGGLTGWAWPAGWKDPNDWTFVNWVAGFFGGALEGPSLTVAENVVEFVLAVLFLAALPLVTHGLVVLHDVVAGGMLGAFRSDALQREIIALSASRGAAVSAEGHSLRRLERDIHDGPQQRLVRLQMDLAAADRQVGKNPDQARTLIAEAMVQAKEALEELRALSRGFAPPILLDRGLVAALESAAIRSTVPAHVHSELPGEPGAPAGTLLPQEIERNAYFVASEAMLNAAKHGGATRIDVVVTLRREAQRDETWLQLSVTDDGSGGARLVAGHGLAGLDERLRGLGGILEITSPVGGPTVVSAHLPLATSMPSSV